MITGLTILGGIVVANMILTVIGFPF